MKEQVVLLDKVDNLGVLGDIVWVSKGYARNSLYPKKRAAPANKENIAEFEAKRAEHEKAALEKLNYAKNRASEIADIELSLTAKAGDGGKLFGSIGARDLAEAATSAGITIEKSEIRLANPLRAIGEYDVSVHLHSDVSVNIKVIVEAE